MAVNKPLLIDSLTSLFSEPPDNIEDCATLWGDALNLYVKTMTPLHLAAAVGSAGRALADNLVFRFNIWASISEQDALTASMILFEKAFTDFATDIWESPEITGTYQGNIVPPGLVGFSSLPQTPSTFSEAATNFANKIDVWFKTGSSKQITPPFTVITWS